MFLGALVYFLIAGRRRFPGKILGHAAPHDLLPLIRLSVNPQSPAQGPKQGVLAELGELEAGSRVIVLDDNNRIISERNPEISLVKKISSRS